MNNRLKKLNEIRNDIKKKYINDNNQIDGNVDAEKIKLVIDSKYNKLLLLSEKEKETLKEKLNNYEQMKNREYEVANTLKGIKLQETNNEEKDNGPNAIDEEEKDNAIDAIQSHIENNEVSNAIDAIQSLLDTLPLYVGNNEEEYYRNEYREKHKHDMEQQQVEHKDGGDQGGGKTQKKKKKKPKGVLRQRTIKNKFRY